MDRHRNRPFHLSINPNSVTVPSVVQDVKRLVYDKGFTGLEAKHHIAALADMHQVDREFVLAETEGWWNDQLIDQLKISAATDALLIECYNTRYRGGLHGHAFDFVRNVILMRPGTVKQDKVSRILKHFNTVRGHLQQNLRTYPSRTSFEKLAGLFNASANILNQEFLELEIDIIQRAVHETRIKIPGKNFVPGTMIDEMFGLPIDDSINWQREFQEKLQEVETLDRLMKIYPAVYNNMTQYHKELILVHRGEKVHKIPKHMLVQWARTLNLFFISSIGGKINRVNIGPITLQFKKFTKFADVSPDFFSLRTDFREGDVIARCPCLEDGTQPCRAVFNLSDHATLDAFKKIFKNYTPSSTYDEDEPVDPVEMMFVTISRLLDPISNDPRIFSKCPHCYYENNYENPNEEAVRNYYGDNILLKHASDVECAQCAYKYCTDCFEYHPYQICPGFPKDPDTDSSLQCCPACRHPTHKIDGCQFMRCICTVMWCWNCRLRRHGEYDPVIHYCPTEHHYTANGVWADNPLFRPYSSSPP